MSKAVWRASVTEQMQKFMNTFLVARKKIPESRRVFEVGLRVSLLRMNECRKLDSVANEKHWSIVSDHIPVSFFSIEFDGKPTRISCRIGGSLLSTNSRKTDSYVCFLSNTTKQIGIRLQWSAPMTITLQYSRLTMSVMS